MNVPAKLKILLVFLLPLVKITAFGQGQHIPAQDDEFNIFLMLFATVVLCGMFGAAMVGAMIAALLAIAVFGLIAFGLLSTSVAIGLYKKSLSAGFKTFLLIVFGTGCGICGAALAGIVQYNWAVAPSVAIAMGLGFIGGALGGVLLTAISMTAVRYLIAKATAKFRTL